MGEFRHRANAGVAQTWPGVTEDLHENLIKAFSFFSPNSNPEREALLFAWHYLQENHCIRKSSRALHTRDIDHTAASHFLTALCPIIPPVHTAVPAGREAALTQPPSGRALGFPFCL